MKTIALSAIALSAILSGCAFNSEQPVRQTVIADKEILAMTRNEVLTAINECESNNTRAVMVYAKRRVNGTMSDIPVDVYCAPRMRFMDGTPVAAPAPININVSR